jgi:hypothetical protein
MIAGLTNRSGTAEIPESTLPVPDEEEDQEDVLSIDERERASVGNP